jgi:L-aminopeptidase/D-esterase-like protein
VNGRVVAAPRAAARRFLRVEPLLRGEQATSPALAAPTPENTTLAVVATNARLTKAQGNRLATVCHDGFARTLWPAHTRSDGDTIFTMATGDIEVDARGYSALEAMATRAVERAVLRGVTRASGLAGAPSAAEWRS